jgi:hypothetical protein
MEWWKRWNSSIYFFLPKYSLWKEAVWLLDIGIKERRKIESTNKWEVVLEEREIKLVLKNEMTFYYKTNFKYQMIGRVKAWKILLVFLYFVCVNELILS